MCQVDLWLRYFLYFINIRTYSTAAHLFLTCLLLICFSISYINADTRVNSWFVIRLKTYRDISARARGKTYVWDGLLIFRQNCRSIIMNEDPSKHQIAVNVISNENYDLSPIRRKWNEDYLSRLRKLNRQNVRWWFTYSQQCQDWLTVVVWLLRQISEKKTISLLFTWSIYHFFFSLSLLSSETNNY